jgi:hypothetical protein
MAIVNLRFFLRQKYIYEYYIFMKNLQNTEHCIFYTRTHNWSFQQDDNLTPESKTLGIIFIISLAYKEKMTHL